MYALLLPTSMKELKIFSNMIFSALMIFLVVLLSENINGLHHMFEILLCSYFALDHTSCFEVIHMRIDDGQFVWFYFYVRSQILQRISRTKILSKFQITSKLRVLIRTSLNRFRRPCRTDQWSSLDCHVLNEVNGFVILVVIFLFCSNKVIMV